MRKHHLKPLAEQVIVITGASSGIGLVTARMAAERGASVMLVSRDGATLSGIVQDIVAKGGTADYAVADVGDEGAVRAAAEATIARFGRIDTWANVAGTTIYGKLIDTPDDEHARLFRTNYFGTLHGALAAVSHLKTGGGALITVGSIVGDIPTPGMGAYAASKHAVKGYLESLRVEIAAEGWPIAVTIVKPSGIDTPIADHAANHSDGAALLPPPVYDPALVAEAILDAAVTPTRDVTVGGVGRAEVLMVTHFPWLLDWLGGPMAKLLRDPARAPSRGNNLDAPLRNGAERSHDQSGRRVSLYRHRGKIALGAVAAGVAVAAFRRRARGR